MIGGLIKSGLRDLTLRRPGNQPPGKVRRQLELVHERDPLSPAIRSEAHDAIEAAAERLQQYLDRAYREENSDERV